MRFILKIFTSVLKETMFSAMRRGSRNFRSCNALHEALNTEIRQCRMFLSLQVLKDTDQRLAETCSAQVPQSCLTSNKLGI